MPKADAKAALVCYLTSYKDEKLPISLFFDRHTKFIKHFSDDTSILFNT